MPLIDPVPYQLIGETAWTMLAEASNDVHHPMRVVTLATCDALNQPCARLMILRGANRELSQLWLHTDADSRKARELRRLPKAAIVAYDPTLGVQMRIAGTVKMHTDNAIASDHWQQMSMSLRSAYGSPDADGGHQRLPFEDPRLNRIWYQDSEGIVIDRKRFMVIEVHVECIEWLQTIGARNWVATLPTTKR